MLRTCRVSEAASCEPHKSASYLAVCPKEVTDGQPVITMEELKCRVIQANKKKYIYICFSFHFIFLNSDLGKAKSRRGRIRRKGEGQASLFHHMAAPFGVFGERLGIGNEAA